MVGVAGGGWRVGVWLVCGGTGWGGREWCGVGWELPPPLHNWEVKVLQTTHFTTHFPRPVHTCSGAFGPSSPPLRSVQLFNERSIPANWVGGDEKGNIFNLRLGVEQGVTDNLLVRAGYRFAGLSDYDYSRDEIRPIGGSANYNAFSVGAGLVLPTDWHYIPEVRVDYGVEYRAVGNDDWQHAVTLSMPFSVCEPA